MDSMLANMLTEAGEAGAGAGAPALLTAPEAERMIEQLQAFQIADVGTPRWHTQREWLARINLQAHHNAATHSDEFIVELLVSLNKMHVLVHDLLVIESWKQRVLPHLHKHLADKVDLSYAYLVLYHECTVANLLELVLFHQHALDCLPEEHLLELADWALRKLSYLNSPDGHLQAEGPERDAKELLEQPKDQELDDRRAETDFAAAMCAVTITRYLCDGVTTLPMGLMGRLVSTHDTPMALVALLDAPPWVRRRSKGRLERWQNSAWEAVAPANRLKLCQADAQIWLALNALLVEPKVRAKYAPDEWRRDRLLGLKRHLHELLLDQLPVLKDLQRTLDEMALGVGPDSAAARGAALLLEVVPELRAGLLAAVPDARLLALQQARTCFSPDEARRAAKAQFEALMKHLDFMVATAPEPAKPPETAVASPAATPAPDAVRITCSRKAHDSGVFEWWADYELRIDDARPPEPVALEQLHGLRYRLLAPDPAAGPLRPLPANGKIVARVGGPGGAAAASRTQGGGAPAATATPRIAQALLALPEIPVKALGAEKPPVMWVNVGLLAEDRVVLQLKLKRGDSAVAERDKVSGTWNAYLPVGGALTILREQDESLASSDPRQGATSAGEESERLIPAVGLAGVQPGGRGAPGVKATPAITTIQGRPAAGALDAGGAGATSGIFDKGCAVAVGSQQSLVSAVGKGRVLGAPPDVAAVGDQGNRAQEVMPPRGLAAEVVKSAAELPTSVHGIMSCLKATGPAQTPLASQPALVDAAELDLPD